MTENEVTIALGILQVIALLIPAIMLITLYITRETGGGKMPIFKRWPGFKLKPLEMGFLTVGIFLMATIYILAYLQRMTESLILTIYILIFMLGIALFATYSLNSIDEFKE